MNAALSWFDWRVAVALLGIIGAAGVLIAWQHRQDKGTASRWLGYAALSLELLGLALSVFWAVNAPDGVILPVIFVVGWLGMLVGRAILIPQLVAERGAGFQATAWAGLIMAYLALYGSGLFHALNDSADAAQARLESSLPAQALDSEIQAARERLAALAGYADPEKAHADENAASAAAAASAAQRQALQADLSAARAALAGCPANHKTRCINPANAEIARIESLLAGAGSAAAVGGGYAARHSEYVGLQAHLVELQKQRAALTTSGQGVQSAWTADDRFIAWLLGITEEQANRVKWLIFTAIFDMLSLAFRIVSAYLSQVVGGAEVIKRKFAMLLDAGLSPIDAAALVAGGLPAGLSPATRGEDEQRQPARFVAGGHSEIHDSPAPQWFGFVPPGRRVGSSAPTAQPPSVTSGGTPSVTSGGTPSVTSGGTPSVTSGGTSSVTSGGTPSVTSGERVPSELSGKRGKGRQGLIDSCLHCGSDYTVSVWTQTCCSKDCTAKLAGFEDAGARKSAWAKGRKA
jgi:hypothetical protein